MEKRKRSCSRRKTISACSTLPHKPMRLRESGKASKTYRSFLCVRRAKLWKRSSATMPYLVRLADCALPDMEVGLFFIGEVVDVTDHLGGFNFQWAWASGRLQRVNRVRILYPVPAPPNARTTHPQSSAPCPFPPARFVAARDRPSPRDPPAPCGEFATPAPPR